MALLLLRPASTPLSAVRSCAVLRMQAYGRTGTPPSRQPLRPRATGLGGWVTNVLAAAAVAAAAAAAAQVHATRNQAALWAVYIHAFCCCFSNEGCYLQVLGRLVPACYGRG
jgi:hypothetical protein